MAFIRMPGIRGLVYVPEENGGPKKHDCKDCYSCQVCSDTRCNLCIKSKTCLQKPQEKE